MRKTLALLLLCVGGPLPATPFEYSILLDGGGRADHRCTEALQDGVEVAAEWRLRALSDRGAVLETRLERCRDGAWETITGAAGDASIAVGGGVDGSDRIEWTQAFTAAAPAGRAWVGSRRTDGAARDHLDAGGEPQALPLRFGEFQAAVPTLGAPALLLLALLLLATARRLPRGGMAVLAGLWLLAAGVPRMPAQADPPRAVAAADAANDSVDAGVDLVHVAIDALAGSLRIRIDVNDIENAGLPDGASVLFLGNSLTYANELPHMLAAIAAQAGLSLRTRAITVGGGALEDHYQNRSTRDAVSRGGHALVIMQQGPSSLPESQVHLEQWTRQWAPLIRAGGARPALYMVWPDRSRLAWFDAVHASYSNAALAVDGMFIPAGAAWRLAWEDRPGLPLYDGDDFHPSALGSYTAALTMFCQLYGRTPVGLPARLVVDGRTLHFDPAEALAVQRAAWAAHRQFGRPGR